MSPCLWDIGMLEDWNIGKKGRDLIESDFYPSNPSIHHSIIPLFQQGRSPWISPYLCPMSSFLNRAHRVQAANA
jgi:hypothetical protein